MSSAVPLREGAENTFKIPLYGVSLLLPMVFLCRSPASSPSSSPESPFHRVSGAHQILIVPVRSVAALSAAHDRLRRAEQSRLEQFDAHCRVDRGRGH